MNSPEKTASWYQRNQAAQQIRDVRNDEKTNTHEYRKDKDANEIIWRLGGVSRLFDYIRSLPTKKILDIGAGTGRGIKEISKLAIGHQLQFEITNLIRDNQASKAFPSKHIHITGAETLRGLKDGDFGGVLAVNSIAYSAYPSLAIKSIDRIIAPGGVFKGTFHHAGKNSRYGKLIFKDPTIFARQLEQLGYDTAIKQIEFPGIRTIAGRVSVPETLCNSILLAIKEGNRSGISAGELLENDLIFLTEHRNDKNTR